VRSSVAPLGDTAERGAPVGGESSPNSTTARGVRGAGVAATGRPPEPVGGGSHPPDAAVVTVGYAEVARGNRVALPGRDAASGRPARPPHAIAEHVRQPQGTLPGGVPVGPTVDPARPLLRRTVAVPVRGGDRTGRRVSLLGRQPQPAAPPDGRARRRRRSGYSPTPHCPRRHLAAARRNHRSASVGSDRRRGRGCASPIQCCDGRVPGLRRPRKQSHRRGIVPWDAFTLDAAKPCSCNSFSPCDFVPAHWPT
jgi:hypothetical protein